MSLPVRVATAIFAAFALAALTLATLTLVSAAGAGESAPEPACVVTYKVDAAGEVSVKDARCDTAGLEPQAIAFALSRVEGAFRDMLVAQAPIEIAFTFSEAVIRRHQFSQEGSSSWL